MAHGAPDYFDRSLIQGKYNNDFVPVKVDENGQMYIILEGQAITVDGMPPVEGSDGTNNQVLGVDANGRLICKMQGKSGAAYYDIAVDDNGVMLSQMKGMYEGSPVNMALDSDGNMTAKMKGNYEGTSKDLAVDVIGRILSTIVGKYEGTPSYTMLENCDADADWDGTHYCAHALDTEDKVEGSGSIKLTRAGDSDWFDVKSTNERDYSTKRYLSLSVKTNINCTRFVVHLCSKYVTDLQSENCDNATDWTAIDRCSLSADTEDKQEGTSSLKITWDSVGTDLSCKSDNNRDYSGIDSITLWAKFSALCTTLRFYLASKWVAFTQRENCDDHTGWTIWSGGDSSTDTSDKKEGTGSIKVVWDGDASEINIRSNTFRDWSSKRYACFWAKCEGTITDIQFGLFTDNDNQGRYTVTDAGGGWKLYTVDLDNPDWEIGTINRSNACGYILFKGMSGSFIGHFDNIQLVNTATPDVDPIDYKYWNITPSQTAWKEYEIDYSSPDGSGGTLDESAANIMILCDGLPANFICHIDNIRKKTGSGSVGDMIDYSYWNIPFNQQAWKEHIIDLNAPDGSGGSLTKSGCKLHFKVEGASGAFIAHIDRIRLTDSSISGGVEYKNLACDSNGVLELNIKAQDLPQIHTRSFEGKTVTLTYDDNSTNDGDVIHTVSSKTGMVNGGFIHADFPPECTNPFNHYFQVKIDGTVMWNKSAKWMKDHGIDADGKAPIYYTLYNNTDFIYEYGISKGQFFESSIEIRFYRGGALTGCDCQSTLIYIDKS